MMRLKKYLTAPVLAYVLLVCGMIYAINAERRHTSTARQEVVTAVRQTLIRGCERTNDLRAAIEGVLVDAEKQPDAYGSDPAQVKEFYRVQIAKVGQIDCQSAYPILVK